jgi:death-on-curing protein
MSPPEPRWLDRLVVEAMHVDQVREHGGLIGLRDENALESALARARQCWHYDSEADLATLAAAYMYGLCRNHAFRDGNKRVSFLSAVVFLELNGQSFEATDDEVVKQTLALAAGDLSEAELANWIRKHVQPKT